MCEAAGGAMRALVDNCRTHHLLPHLTSPLVSDRSVKLRACCAAYLLQVRVLGPRGSRVACAGEFANGARTHLTQHRPGSRMC